MIIAKLGLLGIRKMKRKILPFFLNESLFLNHGLQIDLQKVTYLALCLQHPLESLWFYLPARNWCFVRPITRS